MERASRRLLAEDANDASPPTATSLPWEGRGRRADWCALRKAGRTPMVPWFVPDVATSAAADAGERPSTAEDAQDAAQPVALT